MLVKAIVHTAIWLIGFAVVWGIAFVIARIFGGKNGVKCFHERMFGTKQKSSSYSTQESQSSTTQGIFETKSFLGLFLFVICIFLLIFFNSSHSSFSDKSGLNKKLIDDISQEYWDNFGDDFEKVYTEISLNESLDQKNLIWASYKELYKSKQELKRYVAFQMIPSTFVQFCSDGSLQEINNAIKNGADVNAKDKNGFTPLMFAAAMNSEPKVIVALIKAGADINARSEGGGSSLIMALSINNYNNNEVIIALIKSGANVNARIKEGDTPLMIAARKSSNPEVITTLIKAGADANMRGENGETALMIAAAYSSNAEIITAIAKASVNVNAKDSEGMTSLMIAAFKNTNPEVIKALVKVGADIHVRDKDGFTSLMFASWLNSNPEVTTTLLELGARPKESNNLGKMAIDYAKDNETLKNTAAYWQLNDVSY